jgi:Zn-dependent protease
MGTLIKVLGFTVTVGRVFGIPIKIGLDWIFIFMVFTWMYYGFLAAVFADLDSSCVLALAALIAVLLFVSVIVHELAHSLVARKFGVEISAIRLFFLGGVVDMKDESQSPVGELFLALAGPLMSLLLAWACYLVCIILYWNELEGSIACVVIHCIKTINWLLFLYNIVLPAFPLDGGRILRAAVWFLAKDRRHATMIVSGISLFVSVLIVGWALSFKGVAMVSRIAVGFFAFYCSYGYREYARMGEQLSEAKR